jgi:hypothetical protein
MRRPRLLDLYCGLGGAAMGYHRAGFEIMGVDINPQPDYPFEFVRADAIEFLWWVNREFDAAHASPPCQASSAATKGNRARGRTDDHIDLIPETRAALDQHGVPYVIENVQGSALRRDLTLCGEMYGLRVIRHRYFELGGWTMPQPAHIPHRGRVSGWRHGVRYDGPYLAVYGDGGGKATVEECREGLGIDWSWDRAQLVEAIPPAYTEHIGRQLLAYLAADDLEVG